MVPRSSPEADPGRSGSPPPVVFPHLRSRRVRHRPAGFARGIGNRARFARLPNIGKHRHTRPDFPPTRHPRNLLSNTGRCPIANANAIVHSAHQQSAHKNATAYRYRRGVPAAASARIGRRQTTRRFIEPRAREEKFEAERIGFELFARHATKIAPFPSAPLLLHEADAPGPQSRSRQCPVARTSSAPSFAALPFRRNRWNHTRGA